MAPTVPTTWTLVCVPTAQPPCRLLIEGRNKSSNYPLMTLSGAARIGSVVAIVLLVLAALRRWPYDFYVMLRWTVLAVGVAGALAESRKNDTAWPWILGCIGLLFNPLIPVYLTRATWRVIDVAAAVVLGVWLFQRPNVKRH